jgi:hypothetical protein
MTIGGVYYDIIREKQKCVNAIRNIQDYVHNLLQNINSSNEIGKQS